MGEMFNIVLHCQVDLYKVQTNVFQVLLALLANPHFQFKSTQIKTGSTIDTLANPYIMLGSSYRIFRVVGYCPLNPCQLILRKHLKSLELETLPKHT